MENLPDNLEHLDPVQLETGYRQNPNDFRQWLSGALARKPESELLRAWDARLNFPEPDTPAPVTDKPGNNFLLYTVFISTVSWAIAKIPAYIGVDEEWFYPRFIPFLVIGALVVFFAFSGRLRQRTRISGGAALLAVLLWHFLMPHYRHSDSLIMALLHMPFVMLSLLGFVFANGQWRDVGCRLRFVRYGGELIIYTALILLGGALLTGLTLGLFRIVDIRIEQWYFSYVALWGGMSAPLIATWLWDQVLQRESRLAPLIANVFSPLFLLMTVGYLFALLGEQRSPLKDRDFLIIFNALLLIVWAISVFSITGRNAGRGERTSKLMDFTNLCLVFVTLIIDAVALTAILYRTFEFGITPNRVAVTGANLLIFTHLVWIFYEYAKAFRGSGSIDVIRTTIARYLPVYSAWSVFVVVFLPLLFAFE